MNPLALIKTLLRLAYTSAVLDDTGAYPKIQVSYLGKIGDASMWLPYGLHASPELDTMCVIAAMQGNPDVRVAFPGNQINRPKVDRGEVTLFHPDSGSKVHLQQDGTILIESFSGSSIRMRKAGGISLTNDSGDEINMRNGGGIKITGNVEIIGSLDVEGDMANTTGSLTNNFVDVGSTHTHTGSPTAPSGSQSNTGAPV